jgi:type III restriction enzyme
VLTPAIVGPSRTTTAGIIGEAAELNLDHLEDTRRSTVHFHLTRYLVNNKWRDAGEEPKIYLFGQLKRIAKQWLDGYLECRGGTWPAQLLYQELADMACERITAGITRSLIGEHPVKAVLDSYNPAGSTNHVRFTTSKTDRWQTSSERCHVNWAILDSGWEGEFCRVAESHPRVRAYVKNHNLGLEVPYRWFSEMRRYIPDFIIRVDDGHGESDLLNLIVEIKGYRGEDAKEKKSTMDTYWIPGVNHLGTYGRWAFAEFTEVYDLAPGLDEKIEREFAGMIGKTIGTQMDTDNVVAYSQTMELLTPDEIVRLSPPERIALIAQLWDSLDADHLPLTGAQQAELESRLSSLDEDRRNGVTWIALRAEPEQRCR